MKYRIDPMYVVNRPPDLFFEHLSKAEVHFLAFRSLNLYFILNV